MAKKAVLLLNMGGPNNLDEVRTFLHNMFNDKNIITTKSSLIRRFIAFMITTTRTKSSQEIYKKLGGKSPIISHTKKLLEKLQTSLGEEFVVDFAMRYTPPFSFEVLKKLKEKDIDELLLLPLYPQYSTTTTKSSFEDIDESLTKLDWDVKVKKVGRFYKNELYNKAIINSIKNSVENHDEYELVFSAHSLPQKIVDSGDSYEEEINEHVNILKEMLKKDEVDFKSIELAYQSKLGPVKWLEPCLDSVIKTKKDKKVLIYPISFIVDNSETNFELSIEYKELADEVGLKDYKVVKALNDDDMFVKALEDIIKELL